MNDPLNRLVGMVLVAAETDAESAGFQFTGCTFSAYSGYASSQPLAELVGLTVQSVIYSKEEFVTINFFGGSSFSVSLRPCDYVGPEAFCARFAEGPWVVE